MVVTTHLAMLAGLWLGAVDAPVVGLEVEPSRASLRGSDSLAQVTVAGRSGDGRPTDLSGSARYATRDPKVATVDPDGLIRPTGDGSTTIEVAAGGTAATVAVTVSDFANARPVHFVGEVVPILSKHGCNAGGCHGKSGGQNGFRLSLLGFDPKIGLRGTGPGKSRAKGLPRRCPRASLLLKKPTAQVPHGGGKKFSVGSPEYNTIARDGSVKG